MNKYAQQWLRPRFDSSLTDALDANDFKEHRLSGWQERGHRYSVWYKNLAGALAVIAVAYDAGISHYPRQQRWYFGFIDEATLEVSDSVESDADIILSRIYLQKQYIDTALVKRVASIAQAEEIVQYMRHDYHTSTLSLVRRESAAT